MIGMKKFLWKLGWGFLYYIAVMIGAGFMIGIISVVWTPGGTAIPVLLSLAYLFLPFYAAYRLVKRRAIKKNIDERFQQPEKAAQFVTNASQSVQQGGKSFQTNNTLNKLAENVTSVHTDKQKIQDMQKSKENISKTKNEEKKASIENHTKIAEASPNSMKEAVVKPEVLQKFVKETVAQLNLNTATQEELEKIPGINMILAKKIVLLR